MSAPIVRVGPLRRCFQYTNWAGLRVTLQDAGGRPACVEAPGAGVSRTFMPGILFGVSLFELVLEVFIIVLDTFLRKHASERSLLLHHPVRGLRSHNENGRLKIGTHHTARHPYLMHPRHRPGKCRFLLLWHRSNRRNRRRFPTTGRNLEHGTTARGTGEYASSTGVDR